MTLITHPFDGFKKTKPSIFDVIGVPHPNEKRNPDFEKSIQDILDKSFGREKTASPVTTGGKHSFLLKDGVYCLTKTLAGYEKSNVNVTIKGNFLRVDAKDGGESGEAFERTDYRLPADAFTEKISVSLVNGIIRIKIPQVLPVEIKVEIE